MIISAFGAMSQNRVIGKDNDLVWNLPADLQRFKRMTSGHPVIMGRRTYESMGKPLPNRDNLIVTRQKDYSVPGCFVFPTIEAALEWCRRGEVEGRKGFEEVFVIGGGEIWKASWHLLDRLYLTIIHRDFEGDAFFPEFDGKEWRESFREDHSEPMPYTYFTLERTSRSSRNHMKKIRLKAKHDRRFRTGHPWAYSNELQDSPKGIEPGEPLEMLDPSGKFLAWGYGNPASLITFRAVSRDETEQDAMAPAGVARRLEAAWKLRQALGFEKVSHRLCFGEADRLPGLIVDRYVLADHTTVLVVQAQTAGADRWTRDFEQVMSEWKKLHLDGWLDRSIAIIKNDSSSRKIEGLQQDPAKILGDAHGRDLHHARILVRSADLAHLAPLEFSADLMGGQKTGFFLDQWANIQLTLQRLENWPAVSGRKKIRILDLCCYVGQWSAQLARYFSKRGIAVEVTLVDASQTALQQAEKNARSAGATKVELVEGDVLHDLGGLHDKAFDLVISDPPALIKGRKDIPVGTHAYLQLHTQAARLVADQGAWVACSCSGLLVEDSFSETLAKAARRQNRSISWIARGGQAPDHPVLAEFPEGRYLKCWIGIAH